MALIEWRDEFSVGVADVDVEHRALIDLINQLYQATQAEDATDRIVILDFLGEIYAQISGHFALEEKIMRERHYDQYQDHKQDHETLLDQLRDMMDDYEDSTYFNDETFSQQLEQWFVQHFKTRDARLHQQWGRVES